MKKLYFISLFILVCAFCAKAQTQSSSITSIGSNNVKFFPNPAITIIHFDFSENIDLKNSTFKIFSFIGKKIFETNQLRQRTVVNLNDFSRGVYIFQLIDRTGKVLESSKFVVQK
ncbi:MAG: T9SS type A sorting domain-containing protein [Bacteroidota bacterium]